MIKVEMIKWSLSNNDAADDTDVRGRWHELMKFGALRGRNQSKDSDYVCGSCGTPLSMCGVDNGVPQLPKTLSESFG